MTLLPANIDLRLYCFEDCTYSLVRALLFFLVPFYFLPTLKQLFLDVSQELRMFSSEVNLDEHGF